MSFHTLHTTIMHCCTHNMVGKFPYAPLVLPLLSTESLCFPECVNGTCINGTCRCPVGHSGQGCSGKFHGIIIKYKHPACHQALTVSKDRG